MYNYIKCKCELDIPKSDKIKIDADLNEVTFLCDSIQGKFGEFLIRSNGELCHNVTEYEIVSDKELGSPGVIWNGAEYARIKSTDWARVNYSGQLKIETQIISKTMDASIKINFEFTNGYVIEHTPEVVLIDNTERLAHDEKIKKLAINHAKKLNSRTYKILELLIKKPLIAILHGIGYIGSYIQDITWKLERKLNK